MTRTKCRQLLEDLGMAPNKALGQNYLCDENLARAIVAELEVQPGETIIEAGPGLGALTEQILRAGPGQIVLIEKDRKAAGYLQDHYAGDSRVTVHHGDALRFDVRQLFAHGSVAFISNLPYNVGGAILQEFARWPSPCRRMVVTMQLEVARRLTAQPGDDDFGVLTLLLGLRWKAQIVRKLPADVFFPAPKVASAVVRLDPWSPGELPFCYDHVFRELVDRGFGQRRKQLRKNLAAFLVSTGIDWLQASATLGIDPAARAEDLSLAQWIELARIVSPPLGDECGAGQHAESEFFDVVDERNRVIEPLPRGEVHARKLRHRAAHIFIFNRAGELFLQKRSLLKDKAPGKWDSSAAGHVDSGESYEDCAPRELREELDIATPLTWHASILACEETGQEFVALFHGEHEGPFRWPPAEIETGRFFPVEVIGEWISQRPQDFARGFILCFQVWRGSICAKVPSRPAP